MEASDTHVGLTAVPTSVGNCGLQNGYKTLCASWVSSLQLKAHQATTELGRKEALRALGGGLQPPLRPCLQAAKRNDSAEGSSHYTSQYCNSTKS